MADAKRDNNSVPTLIAVSNADGTTPVTLYADPTTHRLLVSATAGTLDSLSDVVITSGAQGDILYHNGTNWVNLAAGTSGKFLKTQGAAANPMWDTPTMTAAGSDTQVQFNDGGTALGGDAGLVYNKTTDALSVNGGILPVTTDTGALGSTSKMWADLFLASGAVVNFDNGNVTITHSSGILTLGSSMDLRLTTAGTNAASVVLVGGTQTLTNKTLTSPAINTGTIGTSLVPTSDDGAPLGDTTHNFSDLFLATGAVINYANGNVVVTHTSGILTMGTGDLRVTNAGTDSTSVVTVGGTQTLTNKTLTSPVIGIIGSNTLTLGTGTFTTLTFDAGASDPVITAASGILTVSTGDLRITSANVGTNADSVPTLSSTSTLTNKTLTSPTLTTPSAFTTGGTITLAENTSIALDPAGSADGKYTGITVTGTAGAALAFGQLIYLAVADSRWELTDADALATAGNVLIGMCVLAAGADGNATTILLQGIIRADAQFPALTVGAAVYVGETAGAVQVAIPTGADNVIRVVGFALTADEMYFNPSQDHQTTVA